MGVWSEVHHKVGDGGIENAYLTVCPAPDFPDNGVLLFAENDRCKEAFGPIYLQLETSLMRALGKAMIECADEVDRNRNS